MNKSKIPQQSCIIIEQEIKKKESEMSPKTCPFCCGNKIEEGIKLETYNTIFRDSTYIEYFCKECGHYFLI